jgi:hypothetical protein
MFQLAERRIFVGHGNGVFRGLVHIGVVGGVGVEQHRVKRGEPVLFNAPVGFVLVALAINTVCVCQDFCVRPVEDSLVC